MTFNVINADNTSQLNKRDVDLAADAAAAEVQVPVAQVTKPATPVNSSATVEVK